MNRIRSVERHKSAGISFARGTIFIDSLEKGQIINNEYIMALLERLNDEIKKKNGSI
jgi:hypothetical protein